MALRHQTIHQSHCAVVFDLQAFGQFSDRDVIAPRKTFDGKHGLMLLRCDADRLSRCFTEMQKFSQGVAKFRQGFIVRLGNRMLHGHAELADRITEEKNKST